MLSHMTQKPMLRGEVGAFVLCGIALVRARVLEGQSSTSKTRGPQRGLAHPPRRGRECSRGCTARARFLGRPPFVSQRAGVKSSQAKIHSPVHMKQGKAESTATGAAHSETWDSERRRLQPFLVSRYGMGTILLGH
jgi:hypothetical protein